MKGVECPLNKKGQRTGSQVEGLLPCIGQAVVRFQLRPCSFFVVVCCSRCGLGSVVICHVGSCRRSRVEHVANLCSGMQHVLGSIGG